MMTYLFRWILFLSILLALPVLLIRAQPYDDSELRAFLTPPEGCPAPCFMGIRPGVTTFDEAVTILEQHEWVNRVALSEFPTQSFIVWDQPPHSIIDPQRSAVMRTQNQVVQQVVIFTRLRLIHILMTYGQPGWSEAMPSYGVRGARSVTYWIAYQPEWPAFEFAVPAGSWLGKLHAVLNANIVVYYGAQPNSVGLAEPHLVDLMGVE
jgi:hypothetical protein